MKKLFYKALYRLILWGDWIKVKCHFLFMWSPWGRAYVCTAFRKYLESDWFKERSQIFVKRQAFEKYFEGDESWVFKRAITRREKFGIMLSPYTYIKRAQDVVYEKGLIDYV